MLREGFHALFLAHVKYDTLFDQVVHLHQLKVLISMNIIRTTRLLALYMYFWIRVNRNLPCVYMKLSLPWSCGISLIYFYIYIRPREMEANSWWFLAKELKGRRKRTIWKVRLIRHQRKEEARREREKIFNDQVRNMVEFIKEAWFQNSVG